MFFFFAGRNLENHLCKTVSLCLQTHWTKVGGGELFNAPAVDPEVPQNS